MLRFGLDMHCGCTVHGSAPCYGLCPTTAHYYTLPHPFPSYAYVWTPPWDPFFLLPCLAPFDTPLPPLLFWDLLLHAPFCCHSTSPPSHPYLPTLVPYCIMVGCVIYCIPQDPCLQTQFRGLLPPLQVHLCGFLPSCLPFPLPPHTPFPLSCTTDFACVVVPLLTYPTHFPYHLTFPLLHTYLPSSHSQTFMCGFLTAEFPLPYLTSVYLPLGPLHTSSPYTLYFTGLFSTFPVHLDLYPHLPGHCPLCLPFPCPTSPHCLPPSPLPPAVWFPTPPPDYPLGSCNFSHLGPWF